MALTHWWWGSHEWWWGSHEWWWGSHDWWWGSHDCQIHLSRMFSVCDFLQYWCQCQLLWDWKWTWNLKLTWAYRRFARKLNCLCDWDLYVGYCPKYKHMYDPLLISLIGQWANKPAIAALRWASWLRMMAYDNSSLLLLSSFSLQLWMEVKCEDINFSLQEKQVNTILTSYSSPC